MSHHPLPDKLPQSARRRIDTANNLANSINMHRAFGWMIGDLDDRYSDELVALQKEVKGIMSWAAVRTFIDGVKPDHLNPWFDFKNEYYQR